MKKVRILLFGTGRFYQRRKEELAKALYGDKIIGFIDNRAKEIGTFEEKPVYLPRDVLVLDFDYIVLMSISFLEMKEQLLGLGVQRKKILVWEQYQATKPRLLRKDFLRKTKQPISNGKRVLVISVSLFLNGGSMAICYMVEELFHRGWNVTLLVPGGARELICALQQRGIDVIVVPGLMFCEERYLRPWMQFDVVIVNVYQNIRLAYLFSKFVPTFWWIHEPSARYAPTLYPLHRKLFPQLDTASWMGRVRIVAVSQMAKRNFEDYYPEQVDYVLPLGERAPEHIIFEKMTGSPLRFAIIGSVVERKGQDVFLQAVRLLPESLRQQAEFLIIGEDDPASSYGKLLSSLAEGIPQVRFQAPLLREQMMALFPKLDVIVCASREETLSMTVVEGMMFGKICITTDATGIAEYIEDGKNGYIVPAGDAAELASCMKHVLEHANALDALRHAARATYENTFAMDVFGDHLEAELQTTMQEWKWRCGK